MSSNHSASCFYDCSFDGLQNATLQPYPDISGIGVSPDVLAAPPRSSLRSVIIGDCGLYGHSIHYVDDPHDILSRQL